MGLGALQPMHIILIVAIVVIVFGPSKLPELGSSLGKGLREFRKQSDEIRGVQETVKSAMTLEPTSSSSSVTTTTTTAAPVNPLPNQPEPRHEKVTLQRQEID